MIGKVLSAKAAAAAVVAVTLGSGVAAATGSLPTSLQMAAHRALGGVGIPAPANAPASTTARERAKARTAATASSTTSTTGSQMTTTGTSTTRSATTTTTLHGVGPLVPGPSLHGLCVAVEASGRASGTLAAKEPTAFGNLEAAAKAKGESVSAYCASVLGTAPTSTSTTGSSTANASGTTSTGTTSTGTGSPGRFGGTGDVQAFSTLFQRLQPGLLRYARGLVGPHAEDVAQEAWLALVQERTELTGGFDRARAVDLLRRTCTEEQTEVVLLRFVAGFSADEVAHLLGRTSTWVRVTQHRALQRLGERVGTKAPRP